MKTAGLLVVAIVSFGAGAEARPLCDLVHETLGGAAGLGQLDRDLGFGAKRRRSGALRTIDLDGRVVAVFVEGPAGDSSGCDGSVCRRWPTGIECWLPDASDALDREVRVALGSGPVDATRGRLSLFEDVEFGATCRGTLGCGDTLCDGFAAVSGLQDVPSRAETWLVSAHPDERLMAYLALRERARFGWAQPPSIQRAMAAVRTAAGRVRYVGAPGGTVPADEAVVRYDVARSLDPGLYGCCLPAGVLGREAGEPIVPAALQTSTSTQPSLWR